MLELAAWCAALMWNDTDLYRAPRDFTSNPVSSHGSKMREFIRELDGLLCYAWRTLAHMILNLRRCVHSVLHTDRGSRRRGHE